MIFLEGGRNVNTWNPKFVFPAAPDDAVHAAQGKGAAAWSPLWRRCTKSGVLPRIKPLMQLSHGRGPKLWRARRTCRAGVFARRGWVDATMLTNLHALKCTQIVAI